METIQAKVSERLLSKASRLFTGTLEGRVIEVLQNSRRAGATRVDITNQDGFVTVRDNGTGASHGLNVARCLRGHAAQSLQEIESRTLPLQNAGR